MALQVWLPLTKDLRNQGLSNVTVTNNGATYNSAGKLGGCYYFNGSSRIQISLPSSMTTIKNTSVAAWVKSTGSTVALGGISHNSTPDYYMPSCTLYTTGWQTGTGSGWAYINGGSIANTSVWHHVCCTISDTDVTTYLDGVQVATKTLAAWGMTSFDLGSGHFIEIGSDYPGGDEFLTGYVNDFRVYNHCLSPMEVKELSKGLVLHYPLSDNSIQSLDNCYAYPRFETSNSNGGWSHWGSSGHVGTYGQTTDTNYIFRSGQTYAHWVADGSSATKDYLLYQEPAFDGGLRSLVAICKEENSRPITNNICYATWNARNGGVVNNSWTSIESLGDGFYLCKCEGISQDGSNDLVGIYIKPGYKVYFSEVYLENGRNISSDIFFPSTILYDCSGYCYNSILNTSTTVTSDTPKYNVSSFFGAYNTPNAIVIDAAILCPALSNCTIAWWQKSTTANTLLFTGQTTSYYIAASNANNYYHGSAGSPTMYRDGVAGTYQNTTGVWHHYVLTGVNLSSWTALKLNSYSSGWPLNGYVSDLRIYATALSADDVKSLYQNSAYIDSNGNIYGAVHSEV